jgi:predicted metal-binding protein
LIAKLRAAITSAGDAIAENFEISGVACMAGCDRPCTVAYHSTRKTTYLFGDIEPDTDIEDLVTFAQQYEAMDSGWCSSTDRPGKLRTSTLARVPAAIIAIDDSEVRVS